MQSAAYRLAAMEPSKAKVNGNSLGVSQVEITIGLGGESSDDGRHSPLLVDVGEEALLEHGIGVELCGFLSLGLWRRSLGVLLSLLGGLLGASLVGGLLGALLGALLELVPGDHLARRIVKDELDGGLGDLCDWVRHGEVGKAIDRCVRGSMCRW